MRANDVKLTFIVKCVDFIPISVTPHGYVGVSEWPRENVSGGQFERPSFLDPPQKKDSVLRGNYLRVLRESIS